MNNNIKILFYRIKNGVKNTILTPWIYPYLFIHLGISIYGINQITNLNFGESTLHVLARYFIIIISAMICTLTFIALLIKVGTPFGAKKLQLNLYRIGLKNHVGEVPTLIEKKRIKHKKSTYSYSFLNNGISLEDFEAKKARIEAILNIKIIEIKLINGQNKTMINAITNNRDSIDTIYWKSKYTLTEDFLLVLGESLTEQLVLDLSIVPHILIGGASGSGKSVLLKLIIKQCINKNAQVLLADFKGGVDFPKSWNNQIDLILSLDELILTLENINIALESRKIQFYENDCSNIKEFNLKGNDMKRIIFACDEIAEVLDKTGATKEQKERIAIVENYLSIIARQGRAFGIHLLLATQRPDANILSGQIKNNINCRICGRADSVLSSIILDDTSASKMIPKDSQGLFINQDKQVFQGYWINDNEL